MGQLVSLMRGKSGNGAVYFDSNLNSYKKWYLKTELGNNTNKPQFMIRGPPRYLT